MKLNNIFFALISACIIQLSCSQQQKKADYGAYTVDGSIKNVVDKKISSSHDLNMGAMDFRIFENDSVTADSWAKGQSIACMTLATLDGDTINITGFAGMFAGFGFQLALFKDTCIVRHFAKSDMEMYKLKRSDSVTFGVSVPCKTYTLTLAHHPSFKKGEMVEGVVELESEDYYEEKNRTEQKDRVQLKVYFKTEQLKGGL